MLYICVTIYTTKGDYVMFCHKCGKEIDDEAVVCIHCGVETKNLNQKDKSINIVNQSSSSSTSKSGRTPRVYNTGLDILMLFLTGGLWLIWMIARPKYY